MSYKLSVIITSKNENDQKLQELKWSIEQQTFKNYEVIIVTDGDSESAKGIGLRRAKGEIVCILASDNYLNDKRFFERCLKPLDEDKRLIGSFALRYHYEPTDGILNRYFALFGVNDPIPLYLHKNDKIPYYADDILGYPLFLYSEIKDYILVKLAFVPTLGDNGFFIRKDILMQADIEHYFHIDVCQDLFDKGYNRYAVVNTTIWHRTGGNIFKFFLKRLKYANKFMAGRRWHMIDHRMDMHNLYWFIFSTLTLVYPICLSIKGYKVIKDKAWFLHLPICLVTILVYGLWTIKILFSSVFLKHP